MRTGSVRAVPMRQRFRMGAVAALAAVGVLTVASCGTDVDDIKVGPGKGWPAAHHDGRNSGTSPVTGAHKVALSWARPLGGPIAGPVTIGAEGQMFVTTNLPNCGVFSFQMRTGRKRFCNPLGPNAISAATVLDGATNVYLGDDEGVGSQNALGQPRWRTPVSGVPVGLQFTPDSNLLSVTQSGQVDVLSRQTGERVVPTLQLLGEPNFLEYPDLTRPASGQGLNDCGVGGPYCPVANTSAIDPDTGRFFVTVWKPGSPTASLVALRYADKTIQQEWSADLLTEGSATSPTVSADGETVYVGDNSKRLIAVNTTNGETRWVHSLPWAPRGGISVSSDGLIIPSGDEGHLLALRDTGERPEIAWERKDLALRGTPVQTAGGTGYTTVANGDGLTLITFNTENGETLDSDELPGALGSTTGTSIGAKGEVVVATRIGELFAFEPED